MPTPARGPVVPADGAITTRADGIATLAPDRLLEASDLLADVAVAGVG